MSNELPGECGSTKRYQASLCWVRLQEALTDLENLPDSGNPLHLRGPLQLCCLELEAFIFAKFDAVQEERETKQSFLWAPETAFEQGRC